MMENNITIMAVEPAVAHPMTSYKDVTRTCSLSPTEKEIRSSYMDFKYIIPLYGNRGWGGTITIDEILAGLAELRIMDLWLDKGYLERNVAVCQVSFFASMGTLKSLKQWNNGITYLRK